MVLIETGCRHSSAVQHSRKRTAAKTFVFLPLTICSAEFLHSVRAVGQMQAAAEELAVWGSAVAVVLQTAAAAVEPAV